MILLDFKVYKQVDQLPEVTTAKIHASSKNEKFHPEGLYSEVIFGPVNQYRCQCGKLFGKMNAGKICPSCNVLCGSNDGRSNRFAKISLPENIYIVNPIFKNILQQIFGQNAVKSVLSKKDYQTNQEAPYFYSLEKFKLVKESKMKANEKKIEQPVCDITDLYKVFRILRDMPEYKTYFESFVKEPYFLDYVFINYVLVIPPNSRQIIKISATKILPHPITKAYSQILKNRIKSSSVSDQLYQANPEHFGYTVFKYQELVDEIYDTILQFNFQKKESYIREALTGKTIEFSQRAVLVPNPALKPYQIGLPLDSVKKLFLPELLSFLFEKYEHDVINDQNYTIIDFVQYIYKSFSNNLQIDIREEDLIQFLEEKINDFRMVVERQPTLWKYNTSGYLLARTYDDNDDIISLKDS